MQTTISNLTKKAESYPNGKKTPWEKEKLLVTSNFSFSHSVFKRLVSQGRQKVSLCGNGLKEINSCVTSFIDFKVLNAIFKIHSVISRRPLHLSIIPLFPDCHFQKYCSYFSKVCFNPIPDDKLLGFPKLKASADDKSNVAQNIKIVFRRIESIVEKEENTGNQYFLPFPQCFQKALKCVHRI